jgi:uncharacterized lipoprotein YmbA
VKFVLILALAVSLAGCATPPKRNDVDRLMAHPEFVKAAKAAPNFTTEALETVARLNHELRTRK